jgi:tungstate transport system substrate-binding protein
MLGRSVFGLLVGLAFSALPAVAQQKSIILASTTSTEQSGLLQHILPAFKAKTGIEVLAMTFGTGEALNAARYGMADVVLVHDSEAERKFIADGFGLDRRNVMYNDFILVGPKADPAKSAGSIDIVAALKKIARTKATFISRGDRSGTHAAELRLWTIAGIDPEKGLDSWYIETRSGMGLALNTAAGKGAYALTDRGTWLSFENRRDLTIIVEGDKRLSNQYSVMLVNPEKHPNVRKDFGLAFVNWLTSPEGQMRIADYKINGAQLFFPNFKRDGS